MVCLQIFHGGCCAASTYSYVCAFCAYIGALPTAPGFTDPAEGIRNMGLFRFQAYMFCVLHNISSLGAFGLNN